MSTKSVEVQPEWVCGKCGEPIGGEPALRDHHEWCLGDAAANRRLIAQVGRQEGELDQDALVAAAEHYRLAEEGARPAGD